MSECRPRPRRVFLSLLATVTSLALTACTPPQRPVAVIRIGNSPLQPAMLEATQDSRTLHLLFDTGSAGTLLDLDLAKQWLEPLPASERQRRGEAGETLPEKVGGLFGDLPVTYFRTRSIHFQQWQIPLADVIPATRIIALSASLGRPVDGVLGMPAISTLTWVWDRNIRSLLGYRSPPGEFAGQPEAMSCTKLGISEGGAAALQVDVGGEPGWLVLDTGLLGDMSGTLSRQDLAWLRERRQIGKEVVFRGAIGLDGVPAGPRMLVRVKDITVAGHHFDGLGFQESDSSSRLGLAFLHKLDRALLDFAGERFCFSPPADTRPDRLPSQQELDALGGKESPLPPPSRSKISDANLTQNKQHNSFTV